MRSLLVFLFVLICALAKEKNDMEENVYATQEPIYAVAGAVNTFGARLLIQFRETDSDSSVVFSPLSLSAAFFLLYQGAVGSTQEEFETVFGFGDKKVDEVMIKNEEAFGNNTQASIANRLYVDDNICLNKDYTRAIGKQNIKAADFEDSAEKEREKINSWVGKKTSGLIPELLQKGTVTEETILVVINALYFKGNWKTPFPKKSTFNGVFKGVHGDKRVPFMKLTDLVLIYKEIPEMKGVMVMLPYENEDFSMYVFLPNYKTGWKYAEKKFEDYAGTIFDFGYQRQQIDVLTMPKWEAETEFSDLKDFLTALGLKTALTPKADFSKISKYTDITISEVVHQAKIVVDEEGTEAAAATAGISARSAVGYPAINITVDHPFLYFVVAHSDRTIWFQGTQTSIKYVE